MKFTVSAEDKGKRLDKYVVKQLREISRNQVKRLINQQKILVNDQASPASRVAQEHDIVVIKTLKPSADPNGKKFSVDDIDIVKEEKEYLVINKPAGLIVHKTKYIEEDTLVSLLLEKYPELKKVGEYEDRPGIVHRLDKDVSGLMVIPRTQKSFNYFKEQFQRRGVDKQYLCLVYGIIIKDEEVVELPMKRSGRTGKMITTSMEVEKSGVKSGVKSGDKTKEARTEFRVIKRFSEFSLLEVRPVTGRTHQIRVHMKSKGHPIVGDNLYATRKAKKYNEKNKWKRLFLVAYKLSFNDVKGDFKEFEIELPEKLKEFLDLIY